MTATIADVAKRAGVSRGTVSNVLNRPEIVVEKTREKVVAAMRELDFVPSLPARLLAGGRSRGIGLVVYDIGNPFFAEVARKVEEGASAAGYVLTVASTWADEERQRSAVELLIEQRAAGVLLSPAASADAAVERLDQRDTRVVLMDYDGGRHRCSVSVDDVAGGFLAAEHLLERGRDSITFVGGPTRARQHASRLKGIRRVARAAGIQDAIRLFTVPEYTVACGELAAAELVKSGSLSSGVVCGNDMLAFGLMHGFRQAGVRVPDDVAVVGYDDIELARLAATPLTSVRQPMHQMGQVGVELLLSELHAESHSHERIRFKPQLVVRDSTS